MIYIKKDVFNQINNSITNIPTESGGILGKHNKSISHFVFDKGIASTKTSYTPTVSLLNEQLKLWENEAVKFCGFIHSHYRENKLSKEDVCVAKKLLEYFNYLEEVYMLLVVFSLREPVDFELISFRCFWDGPNFCTTPCNIRIIE